MEVKRITYRLWTRWITFYLYFPTLLFIIFHITTFSITLLTFIVPLSYSTTFILYYNPFLSFIQFPLTPLHLTTFHFTTLLFIIFPLTPSTQITFSIPNLPFIIFPTITFHFIIFTLYYTHFTTHPNFTFPFPTQNPFITFFLSHHLNPTNPSIYYFITFNLTNQNSSSSPLFNPQTSTSFYYIFLFPCHPFLHSPNIPSFYYFTPYPTFINHLKKILPHIHNPYHFISHIYSLLNITFIVFYLTLLTLNLIFHFISINQSFLLTYLSYFPNYSPSKYHLFPFKSI